MMVGEKSRPAVWAAWGREESTEKVAIPPGLLTWAKVITSVLSKRDRGRHNYGSRRCGDD